MSVRVVETDDGDRDTDYVAQVVKSTVVVAEGEKTAMATITVTPNDNDKKNTWVFAVEATVPGVSPPDPAKISIVDDEADIGGIRLRATIGDSDESPPTISEIDDPTEVTITAYVIGTAPTAAVEIQLDYG